MCINFNNCYKLRGLCFSLTLFIFLLIIPAMGMSEATGNKDTALSDSKTDQTVVLVTQAGQKNFKDAEVRIEVKFKPKTIPGRDVKSYRIIAKPAGAETALADQRLPKRMYIPEGCKAYRIVVESISGIPVRTFTLGLGYPKQIRPEVAESLRLFVLSGDKWLPVASYLNTFQQMVKTETAQQFGTYRLLAQAVVDPQKDIFVYPNPVQFGEFSKGLKFRNVPPGSVIEIFTVMGEKIRELEAKEAEVKWDGRKENDELVTSGLYLYRVQLVGDEVFGKIAVKR